MASRPRPAHRRARPIRIAEARTLRDAGRCFPVMAELRDHLTREEFLRRVADMRASDGYRLAFVEAGGRVVAVAGYRVQHMLARGRFLYVDDLVTASWARRQGHARRLLDWIGEAARRDRCERVDLDSGTWRKGAHAFYEAVGFERDAFHFSRRTATNAPPGA